MIARPIHTRSELIALIRQAAPSRACRRAIDEDRTQVLGGFTPPEGHPYFATITTSRHGRQWNLAVVVDEQRQRYRVVSFDRSPWQYWDGRPDGRSIHDGDDPLTYYHYYLQARRQANATATTTTSHG